MSDLKIVPPKKVVIDEVQFISLSIKEGSEVIPIDANGYHFHEEWLKLGLPYRWKMTLERIDE